MALMPVISDQSVEALHMSTPSNCRASVTHGELRVLMSLTPESNTYDTRAMDVLHEHLMRARASGGVFARSVAQPPWGLRLPGSIQLAVHALVRGRMWLWLDGSEPVELAAGDVALVRGGPDHFVAHEPGAMCLVPEQFRVQHADDALAPPQEVHTFLCGAYVLAGDVGRGLLEALPPVLHLPATDGNPLHDAVALISSELTGAAPGQQTVLDRLLDVLLVLSLRACFHSGEHAPRWYRAASDARLAPALNAIHAHAERAWTVTELAAAAGLSRATFARHFQNALGQTPMQYLTDWRMTLARDHLTDGELTLTQIATRTGYASPYAFAAAFRRQHGLPPGQWRRHAVQRSRSHANTDGIHGSTHHD
ncbi:cupin domain-containing protein [Lentzea sp. NPDC059081]|uniref:AraC family transcriptional regulator n=1 Tax=Lentzea sp. NPDC059081 TaxID=3346719 RepID=UPI00369D908A